MTFSRLAILRSSELFLIFALLFQPNASHSEVFDELSPAGSVRFAGWSKDRSFSSEENIGVGAIWLKLKPKELLGCQFYFEGFLQNQNISRDSTSYGDAREAYFEKSIERLDIKIGRQIIVWGRADKFNPTDSFTTKNFKHLSSDDEDQRIGQFATQFKYNFDKFNFVGIWQPEWRQSIFPVKPQSGVAFQALRPINSSQQFGFKIDSSGGETDWSVSYFSGFSRTPNLQILSSSPTLVLGIDYGSVEVYGADFAKNLEVYGVRGEVAYTKTNDEKGDDPLKQNSYWQAVLGVDRTFMGTLNINTQLLYKLISNFQESSKITDLNSRLLAQKLATISHQEYSDQFGFSFRPSYKLLNETLEVEVAFITWLKNRDSLLRPKVSYSISDSLKGIFGGEFYDGPSDTLFGQLKDISSAFFELQYFF